MENGSDFVFMLAKPLLFFLLAIGVLFLIVKPFLHMLAESGLFTLTHKKKDDLDEFLTRRTDMPAVDDPTVKSIMRDRDKITKLAESNPEKASELIKKWARQQGED